MTVHSGRRASSKSKRFISTYGSNTGSSGTSCTYVGFANGNSKDFFSPLWSNLCFCFHFCSFRQTTWPVGPSAGLCGRFQWLITLRMVNDADGGGLLWFVSEGAAGSENKLIQRQRNVFKKLPSSLKCVLFFWADERGWRLWMTRGKTEKEKWMYNEYRCVYLCLTSNTVEKVRKTRGWANPQLNPTLYAPAFSTSAREREPEPHGNMPPFFFLYHI